MYALNSRKFSKIFEKVLQKSFINIFSLIALFFHPVHTDIQLQLSIENTVLDPEQNVRAEKYKSNSTELASISEITIVFLENFYRT